MIIVRLDRVLADRKMPLGNWPMKSVSIVNLSNLKTGKVKAVRFSTLDAIWAHRLPTGRHPEYAPEDTAGS